MFFCGICVIKVHDCVFRKVSVNYISRAIVTTGFKSFIGIVELLLFSSNCCSSIEFSRYGRISCILQRKENQAAHVFELCCAGNTTVNQNCLMKKHGYSNIFLIYLKEIRLAYIKYNATVIGELWFIVLRIIKISAPYNLKNRAF